MVVSYEIEMMKEKISGGELWDRDDEGELTDGLFDCRYKVQWFCLWAGWRGCSFGKG